MTLDQVMKTDVACCRPEETLAMAAGTMWHRRVGCLPVISDDGKAIAMLTDRDICMATYLTGQAPWALSVHSAMSKSLISAQSGQGVEEVAESMRRNQVRRLPVVDATGKLVGLVSLSDLAAKAKLRPGEARMVASTLGEICASQVGWHPAASDGVRI